MIYGQSMLSEKASVKKGTPRFFAGAFFYVSVLIIADWMKLTRKLAKGYFRELRYCFCLVCALNCVSVVAEGG